MTSIFYSKKMNILAGLAFVLSLLILSASPVCTYAATNENDTAHEAYVGVMDQLKAAHEENDKDGYPLEVAYKYTDLTGDGIDECICHYMVEDGIALYYVDIYTFENGQAVSMFPTDPGPVMLRGLTNILVDKKTQSVLIRTLAAGEDVQQYFRANQDNKYELLGYRGRISTEAGGQYDGDWEYDDENNDTLKLDESEYEAMFDGVDSGKTDMVLSSYDDFEIY